MWRRLLAAMLGLLALVVLAAPVSAGWQWCARDPIVALNGAEVQILVAIPEAALPAVNGPIQVHVRVPDGVRTEVVFLDEGFNGYGERVTFGTLPAASVAPDGSFSALVAARVPLDASVLAASGLSQLVPLQLTVITGGTETVTDGLTLGAVSKVTVRP